MTGPSEPATVLVETPELDTSDLEESIALGITISLKTKCRNAEIRLIRAALGQTNGHISKAARLLTLNRQTLHEKMHRYRI